MELEDGWDAQSSKDIERVRPLRVAALRCRVHSCREERRGHPSVCARARARSLARSRSTGGGTCTAQGRREGQGTRLLLVSLSEWQWYLMLGALWDR